jgi:hypothetical protein
MERAMRFDLRLHGRTGDGRSCWADISVYASSAADLETHAMDASTNAAWFLRDAPGDVVPEGSAITVESVERLKLRTSPRRKPTR